MLATCTKQLNQRKIGNQIIWRNYVLVLYSFSLFYKDFSAISSKKVWGTSCGKMEVQKNKNK